MQRLLFLLQGSNGSVQRCGGDSSKRSAKCACRLRRRLGVSSSVYCLCRVWGLAQLCPTSHCMHANINIELARACFHASMPSWAALRFTKQMHADTGQRERLSRRAGGAAAAVESLKPTSKIAALQAPLKTPPRTGASPTVSQSYLLLVTASSRKP